MWLRIVGPACPPARPPPPPPPASNQAAWGVAVEIREIQALALQTCTLALLQP